MNRKNVDKETGEIMEYSAETAIVATRSALEGGMTMRQFPLVLLPGNPAANSTHALKWALSSMMEEEEVTAEYIDGVILAVINGRQYYSQAYSGGTPSPPDCISPDRIHGHGNPGGDCQNCQLRHTKCGERAWVFILREGMYLPTVIPIPTTSTNIMSEFETQLLAYKGMRIWQIETRLRVQPYRTSRGRTVSQIAPRLKSASSSLDLKTGHKLNTQIVSTFNRWIADNLMAPEIPVE